MYCNVDSWFVAEKAVPILATCLPINPKMKPEIKTPIYDHNPNGVKNCMTSCPVENPAPTTMPTYAKPIFIASLFSPI